MAARRTTVSARWLVGWVLLLSGCGAGEPEALPPPASRCVAAAGVSSAPVTIDQTVALVNALPKPLSLPCFLEALARPVRVLASRSQVSAQPANGQRSPRLFVFVGANVMTVVPEGDGARLLEMGEQRPGFRSLKAEIEFPVLATVDPDEPFARTLFNAELTGCAFCHAAEQEEQTRSGGRAFVSQTLRPRDGERVPLDLVRAENASCNADLEPARCAMLRALFGGESVEEQLFPQDTPTFGD